jgi:ChrR Cupin-like domain
MRSTVNVIVSGILAWTASSIKWEPTTPEGTRFALLQGVREEPGAQFTYALSLPAGFRGRLHRHPADLRVAVLSGELILGGEGETHHGAGSFLIVKAGSRHYDSTRVETVIVCSAVGPWATEYLDAQT